MVTHHNRQPPLHMPSVATNNPMYLHTYEYKPDSHHVDAQNAMLVVSFLHKRSGILKRPNPPRIHMYHVTTLLTHMHTPVKGKLAKKEDDTATNRGLELEIYPYST